MNKLLMPIVLMVLFLAVRPAVAEPVPENMLDQDYKNCMGSDDPAVNIERASYCGCIRDALRSWDLNTYTAEATIQSQKTAQAPPSAKLNEVATACMNKNLK